MRIFSFKQFVCLILFSTSLNSFSQNEADVVRYLNVTPSGTSRFSSMAGSFGALGGDLTTISINPAGSGIYRKSELGITPGFTFNNVTSKVEGSSESVSKNKFVFTNAGYVRAKVTEENRSLYLNFAITYNKTADFNRNSSVSFFNDQSSMLFAFTDRASGTPVEDLSTNVPFSSYLAYEAYLIDEDPDLVNGYLTQPRYEESFSGVNQSNTSEEKGYMGNLSVNSSIAIDEKVFLGVSLSLITGSYEIINNFVETTIVDSLLLDKYTFNYSQQTEISGGKFDIGIIVKPEKWLRLGLAWHLSHKISLSDDFNTLVRSQWKDGEMYSIDSPDGFIEYKLRNPGKVILSIGLVSGFKGMLNIDVEFMNLSKAEILSDEFDFTNENLKISESLKRTINARIGGEIWAGMFNFRAGYAYSQNPYVNNGAKKFYNTISGGVGFLTQSGFFLNMSLAYKENGRSVYPYNSDVAPLVVDEFSNYEILASFGLRFQ